jgi:hypothetical protein
MVSCDDARVGDTLTIISDFPSPDKQSCDTNAAIKRMTVEDMEKK